MRLHGTQFDLVVGIHVQHNYRRAANGGLADDVRSLHSEVLVPTLLPWVEERRQLFRVGVSARDVTRFREIAIDARQRKIVRVVGAAVLSRIDVLDLKCGEWGLVLVQAAILTAIACSLPYKFFRGDVYHGSAVAKSFRALAWRMAMNLLART